MDEIVGTTGLTAAADTLWALEKAGEGPEAGINLHARGRDIEDKKVHLDVDVAKGRWQITGDAIETKLTPEREKIAKIVRQADGETLSPKEIAKRMGIEDEKGQANVRQLLSKMRKAGDIGHPKTGGYTHHSGHNDHSNDYDPARIAELMKDNFDDV